MSLYNLTTDDMGRVRCVCCQRHHPVSNVIVKYKHRKTQCFICSSCHSVNSLISRHSDQIPRKIVKDILIQKLENQGGECALTREPLEWGYNCSPDHIHPLIDGGKGVKKEDRTTPLDIDNIQIVSTNANYLKGRLSMEDITNLINLLRGGGSNPHRSKNTRQNPIRNHLISHSRSSSNTRKHELPTIDRAWIAEQMTYQNNRCYWSDITLPDYRFDQGKRSNSDPVIRHLYDISIDRLDESRGYHPDNCVICLAPFNYARSGGRLKHGKTNPLTFTDPTVYREWIQQLRTGNWGLDWCRQYRHYLG